MLADDDALPTVTAALPPEARVHALTRIGELLAAPGPPVAGRRPTDLAHLFPSSGTSARLKYTCLPERK